MAFVPVMVDTCLDRPLIAKIRKAGKTLAGVNVVPH